MRKRSSDLKSFHSLPEPLQSVQHNLVPNALGSRLFKPEPEPDRSVRVRVPLEKVDQPVDFKSQRARLFKVNRVFFTQKQGNWMKIVKSRPFDFWKSAGSTFHNSQSSGSGRGSGSGPFWKVEVVLKKTRLPTLQISEMIWVDRLFRFNSRTLTASRVRVPLEKVD
jgi:hypothetical protein